MDDRRRVLELCTTDDPLQLAWLNEQLDTVPIVRPSSDPFPSAPFSDGRADAATPYLLQLADQPAQEYILARAKACFDLEPDNVSAPSSPQATHPGQSTAPLFAPSLHISLSLSQTASATDAHAVRHVIRCTAMHTIKLLAPPNVLCCSGRPDLRNETRRPRRDEHRTRVTLHPGPSRHPVSWEIPRRHRPGHVTLRTHTRVRRRCRTCTVALEGNAPEPRDGGPELEWRASS